MATNHPMLSIAGGALVLAAALAAAGCPGRHSGPPATTLPAQTPPVQAMPPPAPPPTPLPTEGEVAAQSARSAAARGEHGAAIELYRKAAALTKDGERLADIRYALAVLQADPGNPERNLEDSRAELERFMAAAPDHPRSREARVMATLIEESAQLKAESAAIKTELESLKGEVATLRIRLDEKEKELAGIKKVLLQNKTKP